MKFIQGKISRKLMFLGAVSIVISTTITGVMSYVVTSQSIDNKIKASDLPNIVRVKAGKIDGRMNRAIETTKVLADDPALIKWFQGMEQDEILGKIVKERLTNITAKLDYSTVTAASLLTKHHWVDKGKLLQVISKDDPHDAWFFNSIKAGNKVTLNIDFDKDLKDTFVFINVLIDDPAKPLGVSSIGINLSKISKKFTAIDQFGGESWLIDRSGVIKISANLEEIGKKIDNILGEDIGKDVLGNADKTRLKAAGGSYYAHTSIPSTGWIVVYRVPEKSMKSVLSRIQIAILLSTLVSILLVSVLFYFGSQFIVVPVQQVVTGLNSLSSGKLDYRVTVKSSDEIGVMSQRFNDFSDRIYGFVKNMKVLSEHLGISSSEINNTAQTMSQSASLLAANIEEIVSSMEEMATGIEQNTENAKNTDGIAQKTAGKATEGGSAVNDTVSAMKRITERIDLIEDIAYQTNLLALNAAIEAARAGVHGKGFAVVAGEVRKLAEKSQSAAGEISELASGSVEVADRAGSLLSEIVPAIKETAELVQSITRASEEQNIGVDQINSGMGQLNEIAQNSAASSEELASTSEILRENAKQLQETLKFFSISDEEYRGKVASEYEGEIAGIEHIQ